MLTDEQHERAKKLQKEVPLTETERRFLRDVRVALAELRPEVFGNDDSSTNSDTEDENEESASKNEIEEGN